MLHNSIGGQPVVSQMDGVMLLGFLSAFFAMAFYLNRNETRGAMMALAVCLAGTALYGFMQGAWPLGLIQAGWSIVTFRQAFKWKVHVKATRRKAVLASIPKPLVSEARLRRMFGPL